MYKSTEISDFYDNYSKRQKKTGINLRHRTILKKLKLLGLRKNYKILEIGCGIGTFTELLATYCSQGKILSTDISPESIEIAKINNKHNTNVEFMVTNMSDFEYNEKFDVIVLPDVLEHIPVSEHLNLFKVISNHLQSEGFVFIHIPNPYAIEWTRENHPELLQIIDQSIYTDELLKNVYPNDLYVEQLNSYSLYTIPSDYQIIVLRKRKKMITMPSKSWLKLVYEAIKVRL